MGKQVRSTSLYHSRQYLKLNHALRSHRSRRRLLYGARLQPRIM